MKKIIPFKKLLLSVLMAIMLFGFANFTQTVYASQVTIIVPSTTKPPENNNTQKSTRQEVFPVSVIESYDERGRSTIIRRYELSRAERPENIPREDFVFGNKTYTLTDIIKAVNQNVEIKEVTESVEKNSPTNNLEQILALLEREIIYDDGQFIGTLSLDAGSIKVAESGRKTSSRTATVTREYPNLSSRDVSLIPKTVNQGGVNYSLTDVNWAAGNTTAVDYTPIGDYYTANATYSASVSSTKITGYTVTADYTGEVGFTNTDITIYEAVFMELRHPAQIITPTPKPHSGANDVLDVFINANQSSQNNEEMPMPTDNQTSSENQEIQNNLPIIREISREELLEILGGGDLEVGKEAAKAKTMEAKVNLYKFWWLLPITLIGGVFFIFRKRNKMVF